MINPGGLFTWSLPLGDSFDIPSTIGRGCSLATRQRGRGGLDSWQLGDL